MHNIYGLSLKDLEDYFIKKGEKKFKAEQVFMWLYKNRVNSFDEFSNIKKETISIIVLLYLNYWCKNDNEISEVKNILKENENKYQVEPREKHNPDNIFSNQHRNSSIDNAQNNQELSLIERKNIKWYKKIWKTIKNFFRK